MIVGKHRARDDVFHHDPFLWRIQRGNEGAGRRDLGSLRDKQEVLLIGEKLGKAMASLVAGLVQAGNSDRLAAGRIHTEQGARAFAKQDDTLGGPCPAATFEDIADGNGASPRQVELLSNFPPAKNVINFPSGDQNGYIAPSVPVRKRASAESSERSHKPAVPLLPCVKAVNAILLPSGEGTGGPERPRKLK